MDFPRILPNYSGVIAQEYKCRSNKDYRKTLCFVRCDEDGNVIYSGKEVIVYSGEDPSGIHDDASSVRHAVIPAHCVLPILRVNISVDFGFERTTELYIDAIDGEIPDERKEGLKAGITPVRFPD